MILACKYLESAFDYRTAYRTMVPLLLNCLATFRTAIGMSTWHEVVVWSSRHTTHSLISRVASAFSSSDKSESLE